MLHRFRPTAGLSGARRTVARAGSRLPSRAIRAFSARLALVAIPALAALPAFAATTYYDSFESKVVGQSLHGQTPEVGTGAYAIQGTGTAVAVRPDEDTMADISALIFNKGLMLFGPAMGAERWLRLDLPGKDGGIPVVIPQVQTGTETVGTGLPAAWPVDATWSRLNTAFVGYTNGATTPTMLDLGALYPACDREILFHFEMHWKVLGPTSALMEVRIWNGDTPPPYAPGASVVYNLAAGTWAESARSAITGVGSKTLISAMSAYEATPGQSRLLPATDPGISYSGRWVTLNGTDRHTATAGQRLRFYIDADWCYLRVRGTGNVSTAPPLNIRIDGGPWKRVEPPSGSDHIIKVYDGDQNPGTHLVEVLVSAAWPGDPWVSTASRFMLQGLSIAPDGAVAPAPYPSRKVLFLGDSISVGHNILASPLNAGINGRNEARLAAPTLVADLLGVDVINVSVPGMGFLAPMGQMTALPLFQNALQGTPWTPDTQPDAVIINLGTNDVAPQYPDAALRSAAIAYLQAVRAKLPQTRIFMLRPFNGNRQTVLREAFESVADPNSLWVNTTDWLDLATNHETTDGMHPNTSGAVKYAQRVVELLNAYFATLPTAEITSPTGNANVAGSVTVRGNAIGYDFTGYRLEISHTATPNSWTLLSDGASPIFDGVLGQWNTAGWANGLYMLRLTVIANGRIATASTLVNLSGVTPPGDVNGDGQVNLLDVALTLRISGGLSTLPAGALSRADLAPAGAPDNRVNVLDAVAVLRSALTPAP